MTFNIDKTVLVVALTRYMNNITELSEVDLFYVADFQRTLDILTGSKAHLIGQSVSVDAYEYELLERFIEEV